MPRRKFWYPDKEFVMKAHDRMIEEFGGYLGFERGIDLFDIVLEEVKKEKAIFRKAAVLLIRFIKDIIRYDIDKIEAWLKNGKITES